MARIWFGKIARNVSHVGNSLLNKNYQEAIPNLRSNPISSLPPEIGRLRFLSLSFNKLQALLSQIGQLSKLEHLSLSANGLQCLPPEIGCLTGLETLDLDWNELTFLPPEIANLTQLQTFDLTNNDALDVPEEVFYRTPADMIRAILATQPSAPLREATRRQIRHDWAEGITIVLLRSRVPNIPKWELYAGSHSYRGERRASFGDASRSLCVVGIGRSLAGSP